ncbi:MAG: c-type cytochrome [Candidatus Kapaibacteriota bacterium]
MKRLLAIVLILILSLAISCSKKEEGGDYTVVKDVKIGPFDPQLSAKGEQIFKLKCTSCHQYDKRLVGPPLRDVVKRRSADYIISMIVHPEEMQEKNDTVKALVKQYLTKMTNQNVSLEDAKAIYEHLRDISGQR